MAIHSDSAAPRLLDSIHLGRTAFWIFGTLLVLALPPAGSQAAEPPQVPAVDSKPLPLDTAKMLREYFEQMSVAKPFVVRTGSDWETHRRELQDFVLDCAGLKPLPQRVPLDVHESETLDHPWCTVRRVYYQLWPGVYSAGLLYLPKQLPERPAPAMLCPHGHWEHGNAHPEVQKRCLNLARLGYVTFSSTQNHYEDLYVGVSHQTLMIWNNMRALDYLESLADVDKTRIGVAGAVRRRTADPDAHGPGRARQSGDDRRPDLRFSPDHVSRRQPLRVQSLSRRDATHGPSRDQRPGPAGRRPVPDHERLDPQFRGGQLSHRPRPVRGARQLGSRVLPLLRHRAQLRPDETRVDLLVDGTLAAGPIGRGTRGGTGDADVSRRNVDQAFRGRPRRQGFCRNRPDLSRATECACAAVVEPRRMASLPSADAWNTARLAGRSGDARPPGHGDRRRNTDRRPRGRGAFCVPQRRPHPGAGDRAAAPGRAGRQAAGHRDAGRRRQRSLVGRDRPGVAARTRRAGLAGRPARSADLRRTVLHGDEERVLPDASLGAERHRLGTPRVGAGRDRSAERPGRQSRSGPIRT